MNFSQEERRYKVFLISRRQLLQLITGEIQIINIPEWSTILEVQPDFRTRGWEIMIYHPSFSEVPEGQIPDRMDIVFTTQEYGKRKLTFK